jgi:hypothetical protein
MLGQLDYVQHVQSTDEFRWNLHEDDKHSVISLFLALIHVDAPMNNNKLWKGSTKN